MALLSRKRNAIRQVCCFPYFHHEKTVEETYSCTDLSYDLNAASCRIILHLMLRDERAPDIRAPL
jgi:hypothetical protein